MWVDVCFMYLCVCVNETHTRDGGIRKGRKGGEQTQQKRQDIKCRLPGCEQTNSKMGLLVGCTCVCVLCLDVACKCSCVWPNG